jgi:hypothetical protein
LLLISFFTEAPRWASCKESKTPHLSFIAREGISPKQMSGQNVVSNMSLSFSRWLSSAKKRGGGGGGGVGEANL